MSETPMAESEAVHASRGRGVAAVVCVVLAALLTTPAAVAFWGQRTLNDTQRYVDTVGPLVDSPEVQDAIATKVTDAIQQQVDVEAILNQVFAGVITDRPRLQLLVGPLAGAVNGLIENQVREFIASDTFADLWVTANTRAQQLLVRLLKGDESGAVSLQGDQVVLDVSEVIDAGQAASGRPRSHHAWRTCPIPDQDRQIVLMDAPQLEAGPHDLRLRQPGGPVADRGRGRALPRRAPALPAPAADDGRDRLRAGRQRGAGGADALGRPPAVRQRAGRHRVRPGEHGLLRHRCSPSSSAASRCCSGSA